MDAVQAAVGELQIRLDPCLSGGARMAGGVATAPGSAPAAMNMNMAAPQPAAGAAAMRGMDHSKMTMGTPANPAASAAKPTAPTAMDHSKMAMGTPAQPAAAGGKPSAAAPMDHSKMAMASGAAKADPHGMTNEAQIPLVPAVRVMDPACPTADTMTAPKAVYQRKVYYFCSAKDRDQFRKDPVAFLRARPRG